MDISLDGGRESQVKNRGVMYDKDMVIRILKSFKHTGVRMIVVDPDKCFENCLELVSLGAKRIDLNYPNFFKFPDDLYINCLRSQIAMMKSDRRFDGVEISEPYYCTEEICEIGSKRIAISPVGDIYPCDVFYFYNKFNIGNVFNGVDRVALDGFMNELVYMKSKKRPCPAHNYCMGNNCAENTYNDQ